MTWTALKSHGPKRLERETIHASGKATRAFSNLFCGFDELFIEYEVALMYDLLTPVASDWFGLLLPFWVAKVEI